MPGKFKTATKLLSMAFKLAYFDEDEGIIKYRWTPAKSNFVVVVGENASGKSFLRRVLSALAHRAEVESIPVSMEGRQMGGIIRSFVYGDETVDATGKNSAVTVLTGISTCRAREKPHIIVWDEPDIGLSDAWARSMGVKLREFALELPKLTYTAVVITHNKALLRELLPVNPHFVCFGQEVSTLEDWLKFEGEVRPLEELPVESVERFRKINKLMKKLGIRT